jgi:hypothetical protein
MTAYPPDHLDHFGTFVENARIPSAAVLSAIPDHLDHFQTTKLFYCGEKSIMYQSYTKISNFFTVETFMLLKMI